MLPAMRRRLIPREHARGAYAGTVGYFGFDGNMDTCLAIRTMVGRGNTFSVQAGAGIVADSVPAATQSLNLKAFDKGLEYGMTLLDQLKRGEVEGIPATLEHE